MSTIGHISGACRSAGVWRRRAAVVAAVTLGTLVMGAGTPVTAHSTGTVASIRAVHKHNGFVSNPNPAAPCATYLQFTFSASYNGTVVVHSHNPATPDTTYTGPFQAEVRSPDGARWYENPKGSHTDATCAVPEGDKVGGFRMVIVGSNASGDRLQCTAGLPAGTGTVEYWRVWDKVKFRALNASCQASVGGLTASNPNTTVSFEEDFQANPVPDPIFDNAHFCGPIAITPAYCVSSGSVTFS